MATRSRAVSVSVSMRIAVVTRGNRSAGVIEPDTSSRKTRLRAGVVFGSSRLACSATSASRWRGFQGQEATSVVTPTGASPRGCA